MGDVGDELHARAVVRLQALHRVFQRALRLLADGDVANEETHLALRIQLDLVDRDLGGERGPVVALAAGLSTRVNFRFSKFLLIVSSKASVAPEIRLMTERLISSPGFIWKNSAARSLHSRIFRTGT